MGKYRDVDALAHSEVVPGEGRRAVNHVVKRQLKAGKAKEALFDPVRHKYVAVACMHEVLRPFGAREFITGFRKRKLQRRNKAIK